MNDAMRSMIASPRRALSWTLSALRQRAGIALAAGVIGLAVIAAPAVVQAAGDDDGLLDFFRDLVEPRQTTVQPQVQPMPRQVAPFRANRTPERRSANPAAAPPKTRVVRQDRIRPEPRSQRAAVVDADEDEGGDSGSSVASNGSRRSICVRMCDGYFFPIGDLDAGDQEAHEALCQATCPGAPVKLFTLAPGVEQVEQAVAKDGKSYGKLPVAFAYQRERDSSCGCKGGASGLQGSYVSYLRDFTLRAGDTVVTPKGARVFKGADRWPYKETDFVDFRTASALSKGDRGTIDGVLGVSEGERSMREFKRRRTVAAGVDAQRGPNTSQPASGSAATEAATVALR